MKINLNTPLFISMFLVHPLFELIYFVYICIKIIWWLINQDAGLV